MYKEITQKILDLLEADTTIKAKVKTFYFGQRDIRKPNTRYPFIDCKWRGGPIDKSKMGATITRRQIDFTIRVVHKHFDEATAEKLVMDMTEQIETVLDANDTLATLVEESEVFEALSEVVTSADFSIVGAFISLRVLRS